MAVIGCQRKTGTSRFDECREKLLDFMSQQLGSIAPQHWDLAAVIDKEGYHNVAALAYWPGHAEYERWLDESGLGAFWEALEPSKEIGWFMEIFSPSIDRLETVFSDKIVPEGIAHMRESVSGPLQEHVYWAACEIDSRCRRQMRWLEIISPSPAETRHRILSREEFALLAGRT